MKKLFVSMLLLLGIGATMLTGCGNTSNKWSFTQQRKKKLNISKRDER